MEINFFEVISGKAKLLADPKLVGLKCLELSSSSKHVINFSMYVLSFIVMDPDVLECGHDDMKFAILGNVAELQVHKLRYEICCKMKLDQSRMIHDPKMKIKVNAIVFDVIISTTSVRSMNVG